MPRWIRYLLWGVALLALVLCVPGYLLYEEYRKAASEDPLVWEEDIAAFEEAAIEFPPPDNAILFVGSSSIRLWDTLARDMAPIPVIQRGFGGAKINDVVHYARRLVTAWQPLAVLVFVGTNDITPEAAKPPQQLLQSYRQLVEILRSDNANLPIYFIALTPSPLRWEVWPQAKAANALIAGYSRETPGLFYIDTGPALLGEGGEPDPENYVFDGLHLSERGYRVWTSIIRPRLLQDFPTLATGAVGE